MAINLKTLDGDFRNAVDEVFEVCRDKGISMVPYFALRSPNEQAKLWRQSRTLAEISSTISKLEKGGAPFLAHVLDIVGPQFGPHVTNALPGASWHQWGQAVDCFWEVDGRAEWSANRKVRGLNGYHVYAEAAKSVGLTAGGYWSSLKDWPHIQKSAKDSPLKAGLTWPEIDIAMRKRFSLEFDRVSSSLLPSDSRVEVGYVSPSGWKTYFTRDVDALVFRSRMTICADGAPKAYHSENSLALDYLGNAGRPGNWWGIVTDNGRPDGTPMVQQSDDPAPGYYISMTAMTNGRYSSSDPRRYVDASSVPYIVLPGRGVYKGLHPSKVARFGDFAIAYNSKSGLLAPAIFAEIGPDNELGEGSIDLANRLNINSSPKDGGTSDKCVTYIVFPGSGGGVVTGLDYIEKRSFEIFNSWGGMERLKNANI